MTQNTLQRMDLSCEKNIKITVFLNINFFATFVVAGPATALDTNYGRVQKRQVLTTLALKACPY